MRPLAPIGEDFLTEAPLLLKATLTVPQSPDQVWRLCETGELGTWLAMLDRARWLSPPPRGPGALRSVRLGRLITITEEFFIWEPGRRFTFRATEINLPVVRGWAEDLRLCPTGDGGTRLDYTIALDSRPLRILPVPSWLQRRLDAVTTSMMRGISTVLPAVRPESDNQSRP
jgi:hypothetical protein